MVIILSLSVFFQLMAAFFAFRLIKVTGERTGWLLLSIGISLMTLRRLESLFYLLIGDYGYQDSFFFELMGLIISVTIFLGTLKITPLFLKIKRADEEKAVLLKEIHHRVKNNLMVIRSLLMLNVKNITTESDRAIFNDSVSRIQSMCLVHEILYKSKNLSRVGTIEYITRLVEAIQQTYRKPNVSIFVKTSDISLSIDTSVLCGLIITEIVTNAMKYAFPSDNDGTVEISFTNLGEAGYLLIVKDNGIGLPASIDVTKTDSLGFNLIYGIVEQQLLGRCEIIRNGGTAFKIYFDDVGKVNR